MNEEMPFSTIKLEADYRNFSSFMGNGIERSREEEHNIRIETKNTFDNLLTRNDFENIPDNPDNEDLIKEVYKIFHLIAQASYQPGRLHYFGFFGAERSYKYQYGGNRVPSPNLLRNHPGNQVPDTPIDYTHSDKTLTFSIPLDLENRDGGLLFGEKPEVLCVYIETGYEDDLRIYDYLHSERFEHFDYELWKEEEEETAPFGIETIIMVLVFVGAVAVIIMYLRRKKASPTPTPTLPPPSPAPTAPPTLYCPYCGASVTPDAEYCPGCGKKVK